MTKSMILIVFIMLSGCTVPPVSCDCEMAAVKAERGEPDRISTHKQEFVEVTVWHYYWQKAEYTFMLWPTECRTESLVRRSPGF